MPTIIRNALVGIPIHEQYPHSEEWAKAYETMSCLDGLAELYRVTGMKKYAEAVRCAAELIARYESNIMGSVGFHDIFAHASAVQNAISEPCGDAKVMCRFEVCVSAGGEEKVPDMCDYGTAADNFDNNDSYFFNVYL